jgi:hypothetical protein
MSNVLTYDLTPDQLRYIRATGRVPLEFFTTEELKMLRRLLEDVKVPEPIHKEIILMIEYELIRRYSDD